MVRIDVFDHPHLELTRQADDGEHGQHQQGRPLRIAPGPDLMEQMGNFRNRVAFGEQVAEPVENAVGDVKPDGQERQQLDDRFEGDGDHHAFVMFRGVDVAGAEQDGEQGHDQGHEKGRVLEQRHAAEMARHDDFRILDQHGEAGRHGLKLQGDVGQDADHHDHRD